MQRIELLLQNVHYYKANLHCHTTISDGTLTPEEVKKFYREKGYQIVAFTDHRQYRNHTQLNEDDFLAVAAMEVDINEFGDRKWEFSRIKTYHINLYDTNPDLCREEKQEMLQNPKLPLRRYHDVEYINGYIDEMKEMGFIACYNHPYWSLQNYEDYKNLKGFWGMEIYNYGCELDGLYGYQPQSYDEMLRTGQHVFCVSTDDNHNSFGINEEFSDSFGGSVMIGARELTYPSIMEALQNGNFYSRISPNGNHLDAEEGEAPEIYQMTVENNAVHIKCSPVDKIYLQTLGRFCHHAAAKPGDTITEAVFQLTGKEGYIRLDIRDRYGRHACSNAYFLDEINMHMTEKRE